MLYINILQHRTMLHMQGPSLSQADLMQYARASLQFYTLGKSLRPTAPEAASWLGRPMLLLVIFCPICSRTILGQRLNTEASQIIVMEEQPPKFSRFTFNTRMIEKSQIKRSGRLIYEQNQMMTQELHCDNPIEKYNIEYRLPHLIMKIEKDYGTTSFLILESIATNVSFSRMVFWESPHELEKIYYNKKNV